MNRLMDRRSALLALPLAACARPLAPEVERDGEERIGAVSADVGTLTAGILQNAAGSRFIDLDASGTDPWIKHDNFEIRADGSATFSGALSAASGTFAGTVSGGNFTAPTSVFSGFVNVGGDPASDDVVSVNGSQIAFYKSGDSGGTSAIIKKNAAGSYLTLAGDDGVQITTGGGGKVGFYGTAPILRPTVTGSRGGNAALASLLTALANLGLVVDNSS